jgi:hypothetical protein
MSITKTPRKKALILSYQGTQLIKDDSLSFFPQFG